jgi:hypothetical protein
MRPVRRLWSRTENPPDDVAHRLGVSRVQLAEALHRIKRDAGLSPRDRVTIWDDGLATDDRDVWIGNVHDEL